MKTPYLTNATPEQIASLEHLFLQAIECVSPSCEPSILILNEVDGYQWGNGSTYLYYSSDFTTPEKNVLIYGNTGSTFSFLNTFKNILFSSNMSDPLTINGYSIEDYFNFIDYTEDGKNKLKIEGHSDLTIDEKDPITIRFYPYGNSDIPSNMNMFWDLWRSIRGMDANSPMPDMDYSQEYIELHSCGRRYPR